MHNTGSPYASLPIHQSVKYTFQHWMLWIVISSAGLTAVSALVPAGFYIGRYRTSKLTISADEWPANLPDLRYPSITKIHITTTHWFGRMEAEYTSYEFWKLSNFENEYYGLNVVHAGWPFKGLKGYRLWQSNSDTYTSYLAGFEHKWQYRYMPFYPTVGLLCNLLFFIVILLFSASSVSCFVMMRRRVRFQCSYCAYPLGQMEVCPECGQKTASKSVPNR